jgi:hypothetical protein
VVDPAAARPVSGALRITMPIAPEGLHGESVLAAAYALLLLVGALAVERMARRTHRRAEAYSLAGFTYHPHVVKDPRCRRYSRGRPRGEAPARREPTVR